eukprot:gene31932-39450_t
MLVDLSKQPPAPTASSDLDVGTRLKSVREERGFTQGAVANRTKMADPEQKGVSRTALIGYEKGTSRPGLREIRLLCDVLHISPNKLIYGTESPLATTNVSFEFLSKGASRELHDVLTTAIALTALKGHERDALLSLALSLAGRQLGDLKLSTLMSTTWFLRDALWSTLTQHDPRITEATTLDELSKLLANSGLVVGAGNRFRFGDEGEVLNPEDALYPDPELKKS